MRWHDRLFWPIIWLIYLGPIVFFFAEIAFRSFLEFTYDCKSSARDVSPCVVAGHDFGAFVSGGAMAGYAFVFFVIPWLAIGGLFVIFLKLADSWTNS